MYVAAHTALEQQLFEAQRAQEEAAAEIEQKVNVSSRGDKDAIEKLKGEVRRTRDRTKGG